MTAAMPTQLQIQAPVSVSYEMQLTSGWIAMGVQDATVGSAAQRSEARLVNATLGRSSRRGTTSSAYFSEVRNGELVHATLAIVVRRIDEGRVSATRLIRLLQTDDDGCVVDQVSLPGSEAVRLITHLGSAESADDHIEGVLKCQYWLPTPDNDAVVILDFATHMNRHTDFVALQFEAMANSFRFIDR